MSEFITPNDRFLLIGKDSTGACIYFRFGDEDELKIMAHGLKAKNIKIVEALEIGSCRNIVV